MEPWRVLFHCTKVPVAQYKMALLPDLLNAAEGLIPRYWCLHIITTVKEWLLKLNYTFSVEEIIHIGKILWYIFLTF